MKLTGTLTGNRHLSVVLARIVTSFALAAYPAGTLLLALGPDTAASKVTAYLLIALSLICVGALIGTGLHRIVSGKVEELDEYELKLRSATMDQAYGLLVVLALVALCYASIAVDNGGWLPRTYSELNGTFWGVSLYAHVVPIAVLSWKLDPSFDHII